MTLEPNFLDDGFLIGAQSRRWSPRCCVCGEGLGRDVALDVVGSGNGCEIRLTCQRWDQAHASGVTRRYDLSADDAPAGVLEHVALKRWCEPASVGAVVIEWLFAHRLIKGGQR